MAERTWADHLAALARLGEELRAERAGHAATRAHARRLEDRLAHLYDRVDQYGREVERLHRDLTELRAGR